MSEREYSRRVWSPPSTAVGLVFLPCGHAYGDSHSDSAGKDLSFLILFCLTHDSASHDPCLFAGLHWEGRCSGISFMLWFNCAWGAQSNVVNILYGNHKAQHHINDKSIFNSSDHASIKICPPPFGICRSNYKQGMEKGMSQNWTTRVEKVFGDASDNQCTTMHPPKPNNETRLQPFIWAFPGFPCAALLLNFISL